MTTNEFIFNINSKNRLNGTDSNFEYALNLIDKDVSHACILFADVPRSYYCVRDGYNTFTLTENGVSTTITMTEGNYKQKYWLSSLSANLTAASTLGLTYTVALPTSYNDGKLIFTTSSTAGKTISLSFGSNLFEQCGFEEDSSNSFSYSSGVYTLTSVNCIKLYAESTLYLKSNLVMTNDNVLIPLYASSSIDFGNIIFQNACPIESAKRINNANINKAHFQLVNERSEEINLNGINMNFSLLVFKKIETFKKAEDFMDLFKKYMEFKLLKDVPDNTQINDPSN